MAPAGRDEFWILDVEGSRLVIVAERSPGMPDKDIAEMRAILDSIRSSRDVAATARAHD